MKCLVRNRVHTDNKLTRVQDMRVLVLSCTHYSKMNQFNCYTFHWLNSQKTFIQWCLGKTFFKHVCSRFCAVNLCLKTWRRCFSQITRPKNFVLLLWSVEIFIIILNIFRFLKIAKPQSKPSFMFSSIPLQMQQEYSIQCNRTNFSHSFVGCHFTYKILFEKELPTVESYRCKSLLLVKVFHYLLLYTLCVCVVMSLF